MLAITSAAGVKFCIDRTEVTQGQYADFLKAAGKPGSEHPDCAANTTYSPKTTVPGPGWEPGQTTCQEGVVWTPDKTPDRPVVCIDWCDAFAYCAWAGKRLCGKVGGGRLTVTATFGASDPANDANASQWYTACSQDGKTLYPYGNTYDPKVCEGYDSASHDGSTPAWAAKKDVAAFAGCHGTTDPYASIRDLSGSVMEFTDECHVDTSTPGQVLLCSTRGGDFLSSSTSLTCSQYGSLAQQSFEEVVGFRCCKDIP